MINRLIASRVSFLIGILGVFLMVLLLYTSAYGSMIFNNGSYVEYLIVLITGVSMIVFAHYSGKRLSKLIYHRHTWIGIGALYGFINLLFAAFTGALLFAIAESYYSPGSILGHMSTLCYVFYITSLMAILPSMALGLLHGYLCDRAIDRSEYV